MENKILIDKAIGFIRENPKENLSLQSIAENAGFSLNYFDSLFRRHTGYSPVEYARVYKLTRSALELRRTEKTVLDVALEFGYSSPESFSRAFKAFYGMPPAEYRERLTNQAVTWHDLSGRIAIGSFQSAFPKLKPVDLSVALDHCFTHDPLFYFEDMVNATIAETAAFTLDDPKDPCHFLFVSDYNEADPFVTLICEIEEDALPYVKLFDRLPRLRFTLRRRLDSVWQTFDEAVQNYGFSCKEGYDLLYPLREVEIPAYDDLVARELSEQDLPCLESFCARGGCGRNHVNAVRIHFPGKGNLGLRPCGVFKDGDLVALALPTLDQIRDLRRYDIGGIFALPTKDDRITELLWKFVIDLSIKDNAAIGNANAKDDPSSIGVSYCERMGLVTIAKSYRYSK